MGVRFDVETVHRSLGAAAVVADAKKMEAATKALAAGTKQLAKDTGVAEGHLRKAATAHAQASEKAAALTKRQEILNRIMRETGASAAQARKVISAYGTTLNAQGDQAVETARQLQRLEAETRQLTTAQATASRSNRDHLVSVRNLHQAYVVLASAAGIRAAISAIADWVDKAERQERALFQVEARLKSTGNTIGFTTGELAKMASEIQRATGIGDEALLEQAGVILSFTEITKENFRGTLEAALDMAAALGKDVPSQVLALSKALSDGKEGLTQLKRSGTIFRGELKEQIVALFDAGKAGEAQALILKEVNRQYGGAAKAAREHGGSVAALKTEFGDLEEALGELILGPGGLRDFIEVTTEAVRGTTALIHGTEGLSESFGSLWRAFQQVNAVVNPLVSSVNALRGAVDYFTRSQEALGLQTVKFETVNDKNRKTMQAALVVHKRWTEETKTATSWEDRMAAAVKRATQELGRQEKAAADNAAALTGMVGAARKRIAAESASAAETSKRYEQEEIALLETGLRTREEILASVKKTAEAHKEATAAREADEKATADAAKKAAGERAEALRYEGELWYEIGKAAAEAAAQGQEGWSKTLFFISDHLESMIDGFFMLGDILHKAGKEDLGQIATGIGQLAAGDYGAGIGSVAQGFGLTGGGISQFGGAKHGNFIAEGAALGAQYGGVYGALIGAFAGAFVKKGADDLHSGLEEVRGRADLIITEAQGELAEVGAQVEQVLEGFFNSIQDSLNADLDFGSTGMEFHIREDRVRVVVNGIEKVFDTIEEALAFAAQGVLAANATAEGLGANMRSLFEHLSGPEVIGSLEQLQEAFNLAADLDFQETGVTGAYIKSRERALEIGRQYGMNLEAILALEDKRIEADRRALEAQTASVFGVDDVAGRFGEMVGALQRFDAELAASEESRAARVEEIRAQLAALAATATDTSPALAVVGDTLLGVGQGGFRAREAGELFRDDLGLTGATFADTAREGKLAREAIEALEAELAALEKAAQDSIKALGVDEIGKLWTTAVDQVSVSLIDMIQAIKGPTAQVQQLEEIRHRQFLFTLYAQIQQAKLVLATMEGVSQAVRVMFQGLINEAETLFEGLASGDIKFPTAPVGAGGRGGKAQDRKQAQEEAAQAAEDFNAQVALMTQRLAGASDAEIAHANALAELAEKGRAAKMSAEEVSAAVAMLAELQLRDLAADWTAAAEDLGKVDLKLAFEAIKKKAEEDLATAMASAGDNPEAYAALVETIKAGVDAEMRELGQGALSGGRFGLRREARETAREIRFLMNHLEELGLTANQVAQNVKDSVVPELLGIIKAEAQRTGDLDAYNAAVAEEARLERILTQIRLEGLYLELQAANAVTPAIQAMFDTARELLDMPTVEGGAAAGGGPLTKAQLDEIRLQKAAERAAGAGGGGGAGPTTIESLADLIASMQRDAQTPMQQLAAQFEEMMERIAAASGTAEERAQAAALAQDAYNKALADLQEQTTRGLRDLVAEAQQAVESRKAPVSQLSLARTAFEQARASLDLNNEASVQALEEAAHKYLDIASSFTTMVGGGAVFNTAQEAIAQLASILPGMILPTTPPVSPSPPPPITLPPGAPSPPPPSAAGGGFSTSGIEARLAAIEAVLKGTRTDDENRWREGAAARRAIVLAASGMGR